MRARRPARRKVTLRKKLHRASGPTAYHRRLRLEPLEDRRLLATITVDMNLDVVDDMDGRTSLREAIAAANSMSGPDTIEFDFGHDGPETILLTQGELAITDSLTINGPGADLLTIDASGSDPTPDENNGDGSRVFNIDNHNDSSMIAVKIIGLTLTGADVAGSERSSRRWRSRRHG